MTIIILASLLFAGSMLLARLLGHFIEAHPEYTLLANVTFISLVAVVFSTLLSIGLVAIGVVISEQSVPMWEIASLFIGSNVGAYYLFPVLKHLMKKPTDMSGLQPA